MGACGLERLAVEIEHRLKTYGCVRENTGYDTTDPWLCDDAMETLCALRPGSLVTIAGTEDLCAFLGASPYTDGFMLVRHLESLRTISLAGDSLVPVTSPPPQPGDQAVFVGLDKALNGWPCRCGPRGEKPTCQGAGDRGRWFWVLYTRQDTNGRNTLENKSMLLVHEVNLAVIPGRPGRAQLSAPLDADVPRALLQPLAFGKQEEDALHFAQQQVREMLASAAPKPGLEAEALAELRAELRSCGEHRDLQGSDNLVAVIQPRSLDEMIKDEELELRQREKDQEFLRRQRARAKRKANDAAVKAICDAELSATAKVAEERFKVSKAERRPTSWKPLLTSSPSGSVCVASVGGADFVCATSSLRLPATGLKCEDWSTAE
ncbi:unnamed protein product, partial [Effrenium voratum]